MVLKLAAGIITYQDCKSLERTLQSVQDFDRIIVIDGAFAERDKDSANMLSTDGTRELVKSYSSKNAVLIDKPGATETEKRDAYLLQCKQEKIDYLLIIDSDEYVRFDSGNDIETFKMNCFNTCTNPLGGIYGIKYIVDGAGGWQWAPRLWHMPGNFRYGPAHFLFDHIPTGERYRSSNAIAQHIEGLYMQSDDMLRTKDWIEKTYRYQEALIQKEKPYHNGKW